MDSIDRNLRALLLRCRGDNRPLVEEVLGKLEEPSKRKLYHIINDLQMEADRERSKRRRGQHW